MSEETRHNSRILNRALPIFIAAGLGLSLGVTPVVSPIPAFADDGAATEKAAETGTATVYDCTGLDTVATLGLTEGADSSYFNPHVPTTTGEEPF